MKKPVSLAVALALCAGLTAPAMAFSDVPENYWASSAIQAASEKGIVAGFPDGSFRPTDDVTNVQFSVMLVNAFYPAELAKQTDVSAWYMPMMRTLSDAKVLENVDFAMTSGSFDWDAVRANAGKPITRYDMAQMIANILAQQGKTVTDAEKSAAQSAISDWGSIPANRRDAVSACYAAKILGGLPDGSFGGSGEMNRASGCVVLDKLSAYFSTASVAPTVKQTPATSRPTVSTAPSSSTSSRPSSSASSNPSSSTSSSSSSSTSSSSSSSASSSSSSSTSSKTDTSKQESSSPSNDRTSWFDRPSPQPESGTKNETGNQPEPEKKPENTAEPEKKTENKTEPEKPTEPAPTLADGSEITEENVLRLINTMQSEYPEGMVWTNDNKYHSDALRITGFGCYGFALHCSDTAFGKLKNREHTDFDSIRVGDMITIKYGGNSSHTVIVLEKKSDSIVIAEGNLTDYSAYQDGKGRIHWGREITRKELEKNSFTVSTRYPE